MKLFHLFLLILPQFAWPLGVTHLIKPNSHFLTVGSQGACSTFKGMAQSERCNAALFPYFTNEGLKLNVIGKSDGSSIENAKDLLFEPIQSEYLENLFQQNNFNSFTLNSVIAFRTPLFNFTYSPYYLLADFLVFNPGFPEISLLLANRRSLSMTTGFDLSRPLENLFGSKNYNLSIGARVFYYEMRYFQNYYTVAELALEDTDNLISFDNYSTVAGDLSLFFDPNHKYLPSISMQIKNLNTVNELNEQRLVSESYLEPFLLFETYSQIGFGKNFETNIGAFNLGFEFFFSDVYKEHYSDYNAFAAQYSLGLFSLVSSFSKYYRTAGLYFASELAEVGILFAQEDDLGDLSPNKNNNAVYLSVEIGI